MISLKNDRVEIEIAELGAEMRRVTLDGVDVLWSGDPEFWTGTAPVLFPICGGLRDNKYTVNGAEYSLPKHGFAQKMNFSLEKRGHNFVTLLLTSTPETLKSYPWEFEFRITYILRGVNIKVEYEVKNLSENMMYFSIGSHEAYACPEGIEDYDVIFPEKETLNSCELQGNLLAHSTRPIIKDTDTLALYSKFFAVDALVFKDLKSRSATLRNRKTGRSISVDFPDCDYFLLWTKPGAGYICLEPWSGIPSMADDGYAIDEKEGIIPLESGGVYSASHTLHL